MIVINSAFFSFFFFGLVWFGLVWFGLVWFGLVWFGLVSNSTSLNEFHLRWAPGASNMK